MLRSILTLTGHPLRRRVAFVRATTTTLCRTVRFGSLRHRVPTRHLYFRVVADQECDDARHDRTDCQHQFRQMLFGHHLHVLRTKQLRWGRTGRGSH